MNCPNCGTSNLDNASVCVNCGRSLSAPPASSYTPPPPPPSDFTSRPAPGGGYAGPQIPNYLWQSIVVTLCCCLPLGIVSIIFAAQVNTKLAQGDIAGAQDASSKAKMFALIGFIGGLVIIVLYMIFFGATAFQAYRDVQATS